MKFDPSGRGIIAVEREVVSVGIFDHGSNRNVDTAIIALTSVSVTTDKGVVVKADAANAGIIYVGNSDVTAGDTEATDGFPLSAGDSVTIDVDNPNKISVIASQVDQVVYWLAN